MKAAGAFLISLTALLLATAVILTALGQEDIGFYYSIFVVETLIAIELFNRLRIKAGRGLSIVSTFLFMGFLIIVISEVVGVFL